MYDELVKYAASDMYPFHMPGHKRRMPGSGDFDPYMADITEIDGFDNMHKPEGIIKELNERLRWRFGGNEAYILVNGSTSGILAAVSSSVKSEGQILMARNSHKSAYDAVFLRNLKPVYIYPERIPEYFINGGIDPLKIEEILNNNKDIEAVFVTSPTYEGIVSDIGSISRICHKHGVPLLVDSAHGAHAGLYEPFTERYGFRDAVSEGADIVIESLHKTLPCFTQTAMAVVNSGYADIERFRRFYSLFQTSSPSYILMAGADRMLKLLDERMESLFRELDDNLTELRESVRDNDRIKCFGPDLRGTYGVYGFDPAKILLSCRDMTGKDLYTILKDEYHLQPEMAAGEYVLLMTSIMDDKDGFVRLSDALKETGKGNPRDPREEGAGDEAGNITVKISSGGETVRERLDGAAGRTAAEAVYAYPPDIPVIVPGETYTAEIIEEIRYMVKRGITLTGTEVK